MTTDRPVATIQVNGAPKMSEVGAKALADWLRRQADYIEKNTNHLSSHFTARYLAR